MRHPKTMLLAAGLAALLTSPALAADADGNFAIRGIGGQSCGAIVDAITKDDVATRDTVIMTLSTWLGGYLTYANRVVAERFDVVPFVSDIDVLALVVDRCEAARDAAFETAASDIIGALAPVGVASRAPIADLESSVTLREPTVAALQQALINRGFLNGDADGVVGPMTRAAVERFNSDKGIEGGDAITIETVLRAFAED